MIKVNKLHKLATFEKAHEEDEGFDLTCCEIRWAPEYPYPLWIISLGIEVEPPSGFYFNVVPRSSFPKTSGLLMVNSIGIVDPNYRGEWLMQTTYWTAISGINFNNLIGKKVAQAILMHSSPPMKIEFTNKLSKTTRNKSGFGSTGP